MKFRMLDISSTALILASFAPGLTSANLFNSNANNGNNGGGNNGGTPKRDVSLILSTPKSTFSPSEPVLIDVTLRNNEANKPAQILDWVVPCTTDATPPPSTKDLPTEMSMFDIHTSKSNRVAKYLGAVFKRVKPADKDYKVLKPGEEITCQVDLGLYYQFEDEKESEYEVTYGVEGLQLSSPGNSDGNAGNNNDNGNAYGLQMESLTSNTLTLQIDSRPTPAPPATGTRALRGLQSGATTYNGCSTSRQAELTTARSIALTESIEVVNLLTSVGNSASSANCPRYEEWFNSYNAARHSELESGYIKIRDDLDDKLINFDCTCTDSYYAYVYPSSPYNIYMCNAFWGAGMEGYNSKMGTVIHEMSHFNIVAGTDDHAYGAGACRTLANNEPNKAINNADNHEYMAEDWENLACVAGPPTTPSPTNAPTTTPACASGEARLVVELTTDNYPGETSYSLTNVCTGEVATTKNGFTGQATLYKESLCVADAEYDFTILDSYGDGVCCGYGQGSYKVMYKGTQEVAGGSFGASQTTRFGSCVSGTPEPTNAPTKKPTSAPTSSPSKKPTNSPVTPSPTKFPTVAPTNAPSKKPTSAPTESPVTDSPTDSPSKAPTGSPTDSPSKKPTASPVTDSPTKIPTDSPTKKPTTTQPPTLAPTKKPTDSPTKIPTGSPSELPTNSPSKKPTSSPTKSPTESNGCDGMSITVDVLTDNYPGETSFQLINQCTGVAQVTKSRGEYTQGATPYTDTYCVPEAEYRFQINDSSNDGICCGQYGDGAYEVTADGVSVASGGVFGGQETSAPFGSCPAQPGVATYDADLGAPKCSSVGAFCTSGPLLEGRGSSETNSPNTIGNSCTDGNSGSYLDDESIERITVTALGGGELQAGGTAEIEAVVWAWSTGSSDTADFYYTADVNSPNWVLIGSKKPEGGNLQSIKVQYQLPSSSALQAVRVNFRYGGSQSSCSGGNYDDADDLIFSVTVGGSVPSAKLPDPVPDLKPVVIDCESLGTNQERCEAASTQCHWQHTGRDRGCHSHK